MINLIKNLFISKKSKEPSIPIDMNGILFYIDKNNLPYIKLYISDVSHDSIPPLGDMLYDINTGNYVVSIIDIISDMSSQDKNISAYMKLLLQYWKQLIDQEKYLIDEPYIKPTTFNKSIV